MTKGSNTNIRKEGRQARPRFGVVLSIVTITFAFALVFVWRGGTSPQMLYAIGVESEIKPEPVRDLVPHPTHIVTPRAVKALYMTSWVAGTPSLRKHIVNLIDTTEANAIVIDIKDATGNIAYLPYDKELVKEGSGISRIADIRDFIADLHKRGIYVIGRIACFQDPHMVKRHPEWAVRRASDGGVWKDRKGISWIDPGAQGHWEYLAQIALDAYRYEGFDEVNFDYVRFPSDGNMNDIAYNHYDEKAMTKAEQIKRFFSYLHDRLEGSGVVTSADLFGMTTTNNDDLGIGQTLENTLPYMDYVSPMVYPSHYPPTWNGFKNPAANPYEVVKIAMQGAVDKTKAASTTPAKLRPWLQDFDLGADYTADMVRAQIQATYDVGLTSWLLWDPRNKYTHGSLLPE